MTPTTTDRSPSTKKCCLSDGTAGAGKPLIAETSITVVPGDANNNRAYWRIRSDADGVTLELNGAQTRLATVNACDLASCNMVKVICRGNVSPDLNMRYPASQHGLRVLLR